MDLHYFSKFVYTVYNLFWVYILPVDFHPGVQNDFPPTDATKATLTNRVK